MLSKGKESVPGKRRRHAKNAPIRANFSGLADTAGGVPQLSERDRQRETVTEKWCGFALHALGGRAAH